MQSHLHETAARPHPQTLTSLKLIPESSTHAWKLTVIASFGFIFSPPCNLASHISLRHVGREWERMDIILTMRWYLIPVAGNLWATWQRRLSHRASDAFIFGRMCLADSCINNANPPVCLGLGFMTLLSLPLLNSWEKWKGFYHFIINSAVIWSPEFSNKMNNFNGLKREEKMMSWSCLPTSH